MRKTLFTVLALAVVIGLAVAPASAQRGRGEDTGPNMTEVFITGVNFCAGCRVAEQGGEAVCDANGGHSHALEVTDVRDAAGEYVRGMVNKAVAYLPNENGKILISDNKQYNEKKVTLHAKLYKKENVLEVLEIQSVSDLVGGASKGSESGKAAKPAVVAPKE